MYICIYVRMYGLRMYVRKYIHYIYVYIYVSYVYISSGWLFQKL
jgi:hypothetical protein